MCFSQPISAALATSAFVLAYLEHKTIQVPMYTLAIVYFGLMELLQTVQYSYVAEASDNYSMCQNTFNQQLTFLGGLHICFQPLVMNMMFSFWRQNNIHDRIENDMAQRMSLLVAFWLISRYMIAIFNPDSSEQPSEACPNYDWLQDGFDGSLNFTTPNLPGHSCTFIPPTETAHLAWALPLYNRQTYFMPGGSLHFFMMFAPLLVNTRRPLVMRLGVFGIFMGPYYVSTLTPSLHEQAAIWCYFSIFEVVLLSICAHVRGYHLEQPPQILTHAGGLGEEPLEYKLVVTEYDNTKGSFDSLASSSSTESPTSSTTSSVSDNSANRGWFGTLNRSSIRITTNAKIKHS